MSEDAFRPRPAGDEARAPCPIPLVVAEAAEGLAVEVAAVLVCTVGRLLVKEAAAAAAERKCMWAAAAAANMLQPRGRGAPFNAKK